MKHSRSKVKKWITERPWSRCTECLTKMRLLLLASVLCSTATTGTALQLTRLDVPSIADPRWERVALKCEYDLDGKDLYSVKWYKDGFEFFRFMPKSEPAAREFPVEGVVVDIAKSDSKQVTLLGEGSNRGGGKVSLAGSYACEVSSEGPSFLTSFAEANMSVAVPPKTPPVLDGVRPYYQVGEVMQAECTSAPSYPEAVLYFFLNGNQLSSVLTRKLPSDDYVEGNVVSTSRLGLTLRLDRSFFPGGTMSLACQSSLPDIPGTRALTTEKLSTLAASNQRLAQEPPRSSSRSNLPSFFMIFSALLASRFFTRDLRLIVLV